MGKLLAKIIENDLHQHIIFICSPGGASPLKCEETRGHTHTITIINPFMRHIKYLYAQVGSTFETCYILKNDNISQLHFAPKATLLFF